jgi:hypothetical protein
MTKFVPSSRIFARGLRASVVLTWALVQGSLAGAAPSPVGPVRVVAVDANRVADLVLLGGGFETGLREGMICRISRGSLEVAEVQLVGLRAHAGAALILGLAPGQTVQPGDLASVKVSKT